MPTLRNKCLRLVYAMVSLANSSVST